VLSTLNVGAQRSAAKWVKARALAVYLTVFLVLMTLGSAIWGQLASHFRLFCLIVRGNHGHAAGK
jgi:hypothetical protein